MINKENIMVNTAKLWSLVSKNLGPQNKRSNLLNFEIKRLRWITSRINVKPIWRIRKTQDSAMVESPTGNSVF